LVEIHTTGQAPVAIFQTRTPPGTQPPGPRSAQ
jgi:hypothetical protein